MRRITYITAAAVVSCCLGNLPANADLSRRENKAFSAGYSYGYSYGMLVKTCLFYAWGNVGKEDLETAAVITRNDEDLEPYFVERIAANFRELAFKDSDWKACAPIVLPILEPTKRPTGNYRNADNWS